jgi:hypothetical protein
LTCSLCDERLVLAAPQQISDHRRRQRKSKKQKENERDSTSDPPGDLASRQEETAYASFEIAQMDLNFQRHWIDLIDLIYLIDQIDRTDLLGA